MRNRFNEQLEQLNVELIKMGALCEEAISAATKAYVEGDRELGERARSLEQDIDHKEPGYREPVYEAPPASAARWPRTCGPYPPPCG